MRTLSVLSGIAAVLLASAAHAADLGAPPAAAAPAAAPVILPPGCYAEFGADGQFLAKGAHEATGTVGAGCALTIRGNIVIGGGARIDAGDVGKDSIAGSFYGRLGYKLNPNLALYGMTEWRAPNVALTSTGQLYLGAGVETTLISEYISLFAEGSEAAAKAGKEQTSDFQTRVGLRFWIPAK